ncbi:MAG: translocation/assembly module TamB domain-containing protein [Pseudohongiellaceae bacterium]
MSEATTSHRWLRWVAWSLLILLVLVLLLLTSVTVVLNTDAGTRWVLNQASMRINQVPDTDFTFEQASGTLISGLNLQGLVVVSGTTRVEARSVALRYNPYSVLSGAFTVSTFHVDGLDVSVTSEPGTEPESGGLEEFSFSPLPVTITLGELQVTEATVAVDETRYVINRVELGGALQGQTLTLRDISLDVDALQLTGDLELLLSSPMPLHADLDWHYSDLPDPRLGPGSGTLALDGDLATLGIAHTLMTPIAMRSEGTISTGLIGDTASGPVLDLLHSTAELHVPEQLELPSPELRNVQLHEVSLLTRGGINNLSLELGAQITSSLLPAVDLYAEAVLHAQSLNLNLLSLDTDSDSLEASGELYWDNDLRGEFSYSLATSRPMEYFEAPEQFTLNDLTSSGDISFSSEGEFGGRLTINSLDGMLSGYAVTGSAAVAMDNGELAVERLRLATADNELLVQGIYGDTTSLEFEIDAPTLSQLMAELQGSLQAVGNLEGSLADPQVTATVAVQQFTYGDFSLAELTLSLQRRQQSLSAQLALLEAVYASGETHEQIDRLNLDISGTLDSHQVTASLASSLGSFDAALQGAVNLEQPGWQGTLLNAELDSNDAGNWQTTGNTALNLSGNAVSVDTSCWEQGQTQLCWQVLGNPEEQLDLGATLEDYPLTVLNATGGADGEERPNRLPAAPELPENVVIEGTLGVDVSLVWQPDQPLEVDFSSRTRGGMLTLLPDGELLRDETGDDEVSPRSYSWERMEIEGQSRDGRWTLDTVLEFAATDMEDSDLPLQGTARGQLTLAADRQLDGNLVVDFADLSWIEALAPQISSVEGALQGRASIAGFLDEPTVDGSFEVVNGAANVNQLGIRLTEINSRISSRNMERIEATGSALSGTGRIEFESTVERPYEASRELTATLTGTDVTLADTGTMLLAASPDLTVTASSEAINLRGELVIPRFRMELDELPETATDVSSDAVVVRYPADRPELANAISADENLFLNIPVSADVTLVLGDEVRFTGLGLDATLDGSLNIIRQVSGNTLTYGELSVVEGSFEIYNRDLQLEHGTLLFFGALDNPALDIRAVRQVGNTTVGVQMNGTLKSINSQLFSSPVLPERDIVSMLVTNRPFDQIGESDGDSLLGAITALGLERGQGLASQIGNRLGLDTVTVSNPGDVDNSALTLGKYLTPDLFISYGLGLFDRQSVVSLQYELSERIRLQAESGEHQSIDINYSIER